MLKGKFHISLAKLFEIPKTQKSVGDQDHTPGTTIISPYDIEGALSYAIMKKLMFLIQGLTVSSSTFF